MAHSSCVPIGRQVHHLEQGALPHGGETAALPRCAVTCFESTGQCGRGRISSASEARGVVEKDALGDATARVQRQLAEIKIQRKAT